jgi:fucose 4-O-acetylase-like acetyltransferase
MYAGLSVNLNMGDQIMNARKYWIDSAKGIAILLVALGHNGALTGGRGEAIHHLVFWMNVPLFFYCGFDNEI